MELNGSTAEALARLEVIATELGDAESATDAAAVRERVAAARFVVACVGQFKRGKSTLLDALLGDYVLPAGVTPVTAVPTLVRHGPERVARVQERGSWHSIPVEGLAGYVSEELNPGNVRGVSAVEVLHPAPLLANGMCLVDTPGLGSVFEANTLATLALVPHIDVLLVVIGPDPPVTGDELRLIQSAAQHVTEFLVVLNKADRADSHERYEACAFARRMLEGCLGRDVGKIFELSARDQLTGVNRWPDWEQLVTALRRLAESSGTDLSRSAGRRAVRRIRDGLSEGVARAERALTVPLEVNRQRVAQLIGAVEHARRMLADISPVLAAHEIRLAQTARETADAFRREIAPGAHDKLRHRLAGRKRLFGPRFRREAMADAQHIARGWIGEWVPHARRNAEVIFRESMQRFADAVAETWRAIQMSGDGCLSDLPDIEEIVARGTVESRYRFNEQITIAQPASPIRYVADAALAALGLSRFIVADAHRFLDWLLEVNVGRAESDLLDTVRGGRVQLERALRAKLTAALQRGETAVERANDIRRAGGAAVETELVRLVSLRTELGRVLEET
jgi:hypothetical protein